MNFNSPYNRAEYVKFFRDQFLPEDFLQSSESISPGFIAQYTHQVTKIGRSNSLDLTVYEIRHNSENDPRVSLSKESFRLLAEYGQSRALVLFISDTLSNYRLSLVTIDLKWEQGKRVQKEYSNPRRLSFFLGPDAKVHTPQKYLERDGRLKDFDDLKKRFSIEVVNKDFYTLIAILFTKLTGGTRKIGSKTIEVKNGLLEFPSPDDTKRKEFAVRLIGRLVFCWFLKKKRSEQNVPLLLEELLSTDAVDKNRGYYHKILKPLFFEVLNTPMDERVKTFTSKPWSIIPFLNGGLFTPHDDDYYGNNEQEKAQLLNTLIIPDNWLRAILEVFETYNFTIDENTPVDVELSIDPEMLGRIFENLLAEINPVTGETARKSTGSYYTPRPIVEYMVDESLKQYLLTKTGIAEETLAGLLSYSEPDGSALTETQTEAIIDALHKVKIIDPACGSGAFPMGILQKILLILQKLDPDSKKWLDKMLSTIPDPIYRKELKKKKIPNYLHKLGIIRDCIFGVDIQSIAVEISKLRCFLSLVVDEKVEDTAENRGIEHLPNLEFKFVCANSLVGLGGEMFLTTEAHKKINELKNIRDEYLRSYGPDKKELETRFTALKSELAQMSLNWSHGSETLLKLASWEPFKDASCGWFDPEWMFGFKSGFDIVIGNPPYLNVQLLPKEDKEFYTRTYSTFYKRFDIFGLFFELAYSRLAKKGFVTFIIPSQIFNNLSYKKLREVILKNRWLREVLYLGDKIFEAANNDVCVLFLNTNGVDRIRLVNALDFENRTITKVVPNHFDKYDYVISISSEKKGEVIFDKIFNSKNPRIIKDFDVFQGIVTGNNEVYLLTKEQIRENKIEKELLRPVLLGRDFEKWYIRNIERQIIYVDGNTKIDKYPNALRYLSRFEHELTHNKSTDEKSTPWYCLHRPRVKSQLDLTPKILVQATRNPRLKTRILATIDEIGLYGTQGLNYIIPTNKSASVYYLVGILNSSLINYLFTTKFLNVAIKAEYLKNTPIPKANKEQENKIVNHVKKIFAITNDCDDYPDNTEKQAKVKELEKQIDQMVYELYGLTADEIAIVEGHSKSD